MQEHHYSLTELENMMPWEREVYVSMLVTHLQKKAEKEKERQSTLGIIYAKGSRYRRFKKTTWRGA